MPLSKKANENDQEKSRSQVIGRLRKQKIKVHYVSYMHTERSALSCLGRRRCLLACRLHNKEGPNNTHTRAQ